MKNYLKHFIIGIVVLALFVPAGALLAQDELTLEGLAETVAKLTETVTRTQRTGEHNRGSVC